MTLAGILLLLLLLGCLVSVVIWSIANGISPMPSSSRAKETLLTALPKNVNGTIVELGSGWGTLVYPIAAAYPDHPVIGYESSPIPFWFSKLYGYFRPHSNVQLQKTDFFTVPLDQAGLIVCYLYPGAMRQLKSKLEKEIQSDAWVISNTFAIPGWEPVEVFPVNDLYKTNIYLYQRSYHAKT